MSRMLFVNLPVKDLKRSVEFFSQLGFTFNPQFTDENATAMIVGDDAIVMLLVEPYFKTFVKTEIADATTQTEVIVGFSAASRDEVNELVDTALAIGGQPSNEPADHGFMYQRSFLDPDGHRWEVIWMDMSAMGS